MDNVLNFKLLSSSCNNAKLYLNLYLCIMYMYMDNIYVYVYVYVYVGQHFEVWHSHLLKWVSHLFVKLRRMRKIIKFSSYLETGYKKPNLIVVMQITTIVWKNAFPLGGVVMYNYVCVYTCASTCTCICKYVYMY